MNLSRDVASVIKDNIMDIKSSLTDCMVELIESGYKHFDDLKKEDRVDLIYKYLDAVDWDDDISLSLKDFISIPLEEILLEEYSHRVGEWYDSAAEQFGESEQFLEENGITIETIVNGAIPLVSNGGKYHIQSFGGTC